MKALLKLAEWIDRFMERLGWCVAWLTLAMVLVGAWNALARWSGRSTGVDLSSNGLLEAQWYMFAVVFLLGAAYTLKRDAHVRVDVIYGRLGPKARAYINIGGTLILLLPFCVFAVAFTWPGVVESWAIREQSPDPGGLPRYPLKAIVPVAFVLIIVQSVSGLVRQLAVIAGQDSARMRHTEAEATQGQIRQPGRGADPQGGRP